VSVLGHVLLALSNSSMFSAAKPAYLDLSQTHGSNDVSRHTIGSELPLLSLQARQRGSIALEKAKSSGILLE
jgi:hypothetical protein